jgi:uncharacterized protein YggE
MDSIARMNDTAAPVVAVRGEVSREVDPEIVRCSVTVRSADKSREATLRNLVGRLDAVRDLLDVYGDAVEKRETSALFVHPQVEGKRGEKVTGYVGSVTTSLTLIDLGVVGDVMMRLADQEQTTVAGPWWALRPDSPHFRTARQDAIIDALNRARDYAAALGASVTGLIELADVGLSTGLVGPRPSMVRLAATHAVGAAGAAPAGPPELDLEPQRQYVRAEVEARFRLSEPTLLSGSLD